MTPETRRVRELRLARDRHIPLDRLPVESVNADPNDCYDRTEKDNRRRENLGGSILMSFKLRDLYAIKHAMEERVNKRITAGLKDERTTTDIAQEKRIIKNITSKINDYRETEPHILAEVTD